MQIVIDMDDDIAHGIIEGQNDEPRNIVRNFQATIADAIKNGTVLPKGHGDLKDMNDLCYKSRYGCKSSCDYLHTCDLYDAPTIIEADKESELNEHK